MQFIRLRLSVAALFAATAFVTPSVIHAQDNQVKTPAFDFSGVMLANYQQRSDSTAKAQNGGKPSAKFDVERVYLNFRMPAGDRASIRVTTDVFNGDQSATSYYKGWTVRIKYAYLQWNFANDIGGSKGFNALARFGALHNVVIDYEEGVFPRYLSQTDVERTGGFFSSSDIGAAVLVTLPSKMGEVYGTLVNGPGYAAAENDRFKDFAARLTLTPRGNHDDWTKTLAISPYFYAGKTASKFQNGGAGQIGPVTDGLSRNRAGIFISDKDPRLTLGLGYGSRTDTGEPSGSNTAADPRVMADVTGRVMSGFAIVRPGAFSDPKSAAAKWAVIGRVDNFKPNTDLDPGVQLTIFGVSYDVNARTTFSLDAQNLSRKNGSKTAETKQLFVHMQATF